MVPNDIMLDALSARLLAIATLVITVSGIADTGLAQGEPDYSSEQALAEWIDNNKDKYGLWDLDDLIDSGALRVFMSLEGLPGAHAETGVTADGTLVILLDVTDWKKHGMFATLLSLLHEQGHITEDHPPQDGTDPQQDACSEADAICAELEGLQNIVHWNIAHDIVPAIDCSVVHYVQGRYRDQSGKCTGEFWIGDDGSSPSYSFYDFLGC